MKNILETIIFWIVLVLYLLFCCVLYPFRLIYRIFVKSEIDDYYSSGPYRGMPKL